MKILKEYLEIKDKIKAYKAKEIDLKQQLTNKISSNKKNCYIEDGVQVTLVTQKRKGPIDTEKLEAADINVDLYRKPDIEVISIKWIEIV